MASDGPDDQEPTQPTPAVAPTEQVPVATPGDGGDNGRAANNRRRFVWILVGVFAVGIIAGGLIVWLTRDDSKNDAVSVTPVADSATTSSVSNASNTTSPPTTASGSAPTTASSGGGGGGTPTPPTSPATSAPQVTITKFTGTTDNACNATPPAPGVSFTVPPVNPQAALTWSTQRATSVDISIDGPGVYQHNIGASGSMMLPFSCPGPHTYVLTAHGANGSVATKTITVKKPNQ